MSDHHDEGPAAPAQRSRTVVVSFLGAIVRPMGSWMPIGGAVDLVTQLGLDAPSVRTAVFRLTRRGWLESEARDGIRGYALTQTALKALSAGDEIVWHARQPADLSDGWCIFTFSVPESARTKRHQLRSHLTSLGFGNAGAGVWIAPARMRDAAVQAIDELGLTQRCALFVGDYAGGQDLMRLLAQSWDLEDIDARYREFIARHSGVRAALDGGQCLDGAQAFVAYLGLIDEWRRLPFRDPGLPPEVLPPDWSAPAAGELFERLVETLGERALAYAATHWPADA
ncbi:PaaX family transcriptional regulator [Intrasporangium oryzae NRRL B-24470]|uniref:PaaX family transcriptional regulator n=1 Tax=Intrasporangium oryzae NRRL B-24470 TaxID=1386089 RepID=W9G8J4_9MICO|nr:PaaX family transcriptional regulator C-terminal domain-containing protein [Intrasporangium oryzae]EWT01562.1 PaaX family transcriptional regulator [Intrasporangium oryzae NRRL B-24470]